MFLWVVTAVDVGDSCDGKARVLKLCTSKKDALDYIDKDMTEYYKKMSLEYDGCVNMDMKKMYIYDDKYDNGCEWNFEKIGIISKEEIKKSEQVLIDNGIEKDEAQVVLQALGYTLLGVELYPEEKEDD